MQEVERRDRSGRPQLSQTNFRVPSSRSSYGNTPSWVEKATKDFLDSAGDAEFDITIKKLPYTKPELRESIKRRIMAGSKGGRPGQWSARKAQLLAQEYRKAGGGYRGKPGRAQRSLKKWTKERWTTADGKPAQRNGRMTRYLPAAAWKRLTPSQRRATIAKKLSGDKTGRQFVPNTARAASASKKIRSKTLGPSVEEISKDPNSKPVFQSTPDVQKLEVEKPKRIERYEPDREKLRDLQSSLSYGDNEPIRPFNYGNIDIDNRKPVEKESGSLVVIDPFIIDGIGEEAGMFIIVPRITKFGQTVDDEAARSLYQKTGDHLGKFKTADEAQIYLNWLTDIEDDIAYRDKKKPITSITPLAESTPPDGLDEFESRRRAMRKKIHDLTEKYLKEKSIGPALRAVNSIQIYDPDAVDADNDGFVQDATPWMRPALPSSPVIAGLRSTRKSNAATQRSIKEAQEFMKLVSQYEPDLTDMMKGLANKKGSSLYLRGLKNRKKPIESLALKAQRLQHLFDNNLSDAITSMNDPLRYTFESDDITKYTDDVLGLISSLAKKGHIAKLTNYWTSGDPYKGVNAMVQHPAGFFYEIQFHTPSSYRLKNKLTPLYEKYRDEKNLNKRQGIYDEMLKLSKGVTTPKDIGKFGAPENRGSGKPEFVPVRPGKLTPSPTSSKRKRHSGVESSRRRMMTDAEKQRFQPLNLADDEKTKLQPGTTLVFANEYDEIVRTELIGPQVARVRGVPGVKLYIDPEPDNKDEVERIMKDWDEKFGPIDSPQRQARGRSAPRRDSRERQQPRIEREDSLDRINRLVDEDRKRRGLDSRRRPGMSSKRSPEHELAHSYFSLFANGGERDEFDDLAIANLMSEEQLMQKAYDYVRQRILKLAKQGKTGEEMATELDIPLLGVAMTSATIPITDLFSIFRGDKFSGQLSKFAILHALITDPESLLEEEPYSTNLSQLGKDIVAILGTPKSSAMNLSAHIRQVSKYVSLQQFADIFDTDLATALSARYRSNMPFSAAPQVADELGMTLVDFFDSPISDANPFIRASHGIMGNLGKVLLRDALEEHIADLIEAGDTKLANEFRKVVDSLENSMKRRDTDTLDDDQWMDWAIEGPVSRIVGEGGDKGEEVLDDIIGRIEGNDSMDDVAKDYDTSVEDISVALIGFSKLPKDEDTAAAYVYRTLINSNPGLPDSNTLDNVMSMPNSKTLAKILGVSEEYLAYLVRNYAKDNDLPFDYLFEAFSYHGINAPFIAKVLSMTVPDVIDMLIEEDIQFEERRLLRGLPKSNLPKTRTALLGSEFKKLIDEDGYSPEDVALMMDIDVSDVRARIKEWEDGLLLARKMRKPISGLDDDE